MDRAIALSTLEEHQATLRGLGIEHLSLFGSVARDEAKSSSDVDLAATFFDTPGWTALDFVGVQQRLEQMLGIKVDLVSEPARKARPQSEIDRDRVRVF